MDYCLLMNTDLSAVTREILEVGGMTECKLAERVKTSQATIHRIKTGLVLNPSFRIGNLLLQIREEVVGRKAS